MQHIHVQVKTFLCYQLGTLLVTSRRYQITFAKEELCNVQYGHTTFNSKETFLLNTHGGKGGVFPFLFFFNGIQLAAEREALLRHGTYTELVYNSIQEYIQAKSGTANGQSLKKKVNQKANIKETFKHDVISLPAALCRLSPPLQTQHCPPVCVLVLGSRNKVNKQHEEAEHRRD